MRSAQTAEHGGVEVTVTTALGTSGAVKGAYRMRAQVAASAAYPAATTT